MHSGPSLEITLGPSFPQPLHLVHRQTLLSSPPKCTGCMHTVCTLSLQQANEHTHDLTYLSFFVVRTFTIYSALEITGLHFPFLL